MNGMSSFGCSHEDRVLAGSGQGVKVCKCKWEGRSVGHYSSNSAGVGRP